MSTVDFDWNDARTFLAVVRAGSFKVAATILGKDVATVSRRISNLERDLGRSLLERSSGPGAIVRILDEAVDVLDSVILMEEQAQNIVTWAADTSASKPARVRASDLIISTVLAPILTSHRTGPFRRGTGPISRIDPSAVEILSEESADKEDIRFQFLPSTSTPEGVGELVRKLVTVPFVPLLTDQYAAKYGEPRNFEDLTRHRMATLTLYDRLDRQGAMAPWNQVAKSNAHHLFRSPSVSSVERLAKAGEAVVLLPAYMSEAIDQLRPVKCACPPMAADLWGVTAKEVQVKGRVRVVYDAIVEALRGADWGSSPTQTSGS